MRRLVYLLVLFVMFVTTAKAEIFYSTLKIGEETTLRVNATPLSNHYVSRYDWWFPSICVTSTSGGSLFDSYCTILATGATKYVTGGRVEMPCLPKGVRTFNRHAFENCNIFHNCERRWRWSDRRGNGDQAG